jgi:hypothetical protein
MTENEKKAHQLLMAQKGRRPDELWHEFHERHVIALSAAGLLRTELDDRAREACKAHELAHPSHSRLGRRDPCAKCSFAGRDILAAEKPVERWTMRLGHGVSRWFIYFDNEPTEKAFPSDAEPEARAYVARKNAEDAR